MRTWVFNCNLHELSISTYKQLRTVKAIFMYVFNSFYLFFLYIYILGLQYLFMIIYVYIVL